MKQYVLAVEGQSPEEAAAISSALTKLGMEWWTWIPGFWLLAAEGGPEKVSTKDLRDVVLKCLTQNNDVFIALVEPKLFGGRTSNRQRVLAWLNKWWRGPQQDVVE